METSVDRIKEPANKVTRPFGNGSMFYCQPTILLQASRTGPSAPSFFPWRTGRDYLSIPFTASLNIFCFPAEKRIVRLVTTLS
jgi:hypothetical protein